MKTHAVISNHLATAVAALVRWDKICNDKLAEAKAKKLCSFILEHQSKDGWFKEYEAEQIRAIKLCVFIIWPMCIFKGQIGN